MATEMAICLPKAEGSLCSQGGVNEQGKCHKHSELHKASQCIRQHCIDVFCTEIVSTLRRVLGSVIKFHVLHSGKQGPWAEHVIFHLVLGSQERFQVELWKHAGSGPSLTPGHKA